MKGQHLKMKDLVTIGVFAAIYFLAMFGVGMMGIVPILFMVYPTILGIVTGIIILLFMVKVQKPWALFILGVLSPFLMFAMGHTYVIAIHALVVMFIAEMIRRIGGYDSFKYNLLALAVFNTWICGSLMQMLWAKEKYIELSMMMGKDYVDALERLITYPNMALVYVGAFVGGIIGGLIGKVLLKKHFAKAGVV